MFIYTHLKGVFVSRLEELPENISDYVPLAQTVERKITSSSEHSQGTSQINKQPIATIITKESFGQEKSVVPNAISHPDIEQNRTEPSLPESDSQPSVKKRYVALWQKYSQRLTVNDPVNLDIQVARKAFRDGQTQKDIALMLSAGSSMVRRLVQEQGKQPAMIYVNQMVRKVISKYEGRTIRPRHKKTIEWNQIL